MFCYFSCKLYYWGLPIYLVFHWVWITIHFKTISAKFLITSGKNSERYYRKSTWVPCLSWVINLPITNSFFRSPDIKYNEKPSTGNLFVPCRRIDRHDGNRRRFSYLRMYLTMYRGAVHTATPPYNFTAWYRDSLTFTNALHTHLHPFHSSCQSNHFEPLLGEFCSDGCSNAAAWSCYHSHTPWPALHLTNRKQ